MSGLLRYDLSRQDVVKWVEFARQVFGVILVSIVTMAGVSAILSTKQAEGLLLDSLSAQGRAIADALARSVFVPLTLEDEKTLASLLNLYRDVGDVASVRILSPDGRVLHEVVRGTSKATMVTVRSPIVPILDPSETRRPAKPIGSVEVLLWSDQIKAKARTIAWVNVLVSGVLALGVSVIGFLMIRNLVTRMQDLIGEARLVEEVKKANSELESFSYSVSHDLRAPLRAIDGFSKILQEDYAPALDAEGRRLLGTVCANARQMGRLIDDLLAFSRLGRKALEKTSVDMEALADSVVGQLRTAEPRRSIAVERKPLPGAHADAALLQQVMTNLVSNAFKFTSQKPEARVEIGFAEGAFFVKDNGAGFDMKYSKKLFGVFSRLHRADEFEGTGVGLALVHRIVSRHGGRVWADARPGEGATFYFTLPDSAGGTT
ncbi:MAG: hypothetical protein HY077_10960 [Elusimicrobia bacterium]|nr:hypothetical protein [Elusimicrobiota bacterium]